MAAFRSAGEGFRVGNALNLLSGINLKDRAFEAAHRNIAEAAGIFQQTDDMHALVRVFIIGSALAIAEGDPERAARLSGAADRLKEPLGEIATPLQLLRLDDPVPAARTALGEASFESAYNAGRAASLADMVAFVQTPSAVSPSAAAS